MAVDVPGLVAVVIFYILILVIGVWASRKSRREERKCAAAQSEVVIVGGRNINVLVGVFTMTATWVGGTYIMGTAEAVYTPRKGLVWATGPPAYFLCFLLAGLFFAKPMRSQRYLTMMDPFQRRYGTVFTTFLLLPALVGDLLWVSGTLAALGGTMSVILGLPSLYSVLVSAAVSISYTLLGGLYAVAYTDVIQLIIMFCSLWLCVPFLVLSPASGDITLPSFINQTSDITLPSFINQSYQTPWTGELRLEDAGMWMDEMLLLALGSLTYQALYQRVLSAASASQAQVTCYVSAGIVFILGVPSVIIGAVATSTDWNRTSYGLPAPFERGEAGRILPLALKTLTPPWVSVLGIASLTAAVMSSMDSALLSSASMFTHNVYKRTLRTQASERELALVIRSCVLLMGLCGAGLAFTEDSVFSFWILSGDLLYVVLFPQLVCVLHCPFANRYGAAAGYFLGVLLRLLAGEPLLGLPAAILYPGWREGEEEGGVPRQGFPFRTLAVLGSFAGVTLGSWVARWAFARRLLPPSWDLLGVLEEEEKEEEEKKEVEEEEGEREEEETCDFIQ